MKKIVFLYFSMNIIFINILNNLNSKKKIYFLTSHLNYLNPNSGITKIELKDGFNFFNKFIIRKNLIKNLRQIKPVKIFVTDIYWAEFFQTFYYKLKNPKVELILYSEVQRLPKNIIGKFFGIILLDILFKYFLSKKVSKILCFTSDGVKFYEKILPKRKNNIYLLPAVINTNIFKPMKNKKYFINNNLKLLIIARMIDYKNYLDLLKALKYLKEKNKLINITLSILGDGPLKEKILLKIKKYNLEKNIIFLKKVENKKIKNYYYSHDIIILPSFNEAIGMVVPEAMACGLSTITSDTVGANTYVKNNKTGLIFKTSDYKDLANKILELNNKKKLEKFGKASSKHILKNFSLNNVQNYFRKV